MELGVLCRACQPPNQDRFMDTTSGSHSPGQCVCRAHHLEKRDTVNINGGGRVQNETEADLYSDSPRYRKQAVGMRQRSGKDPPHDPHQRQGEGVGETEGERQTAAVHAHKTPKFILRQRGWLEGVCDPGGRNTKTSSTWRSCA